MPRCSRGWGSLNITGAFFAAGAHFLQHTAWKLRYEEDRQGYTRGYACTSGSSRWNPAGKETQASTANGPFCWQHIVVITKSGPCSTSVTESNSAAAMCSVTCPCNVMVTCKCPWIQGQVLISSNLKPWLKHCTALTLFPQNQTQISSFYSIPETCWKNVLVLIVNIWFKLHLGL